MAYSRSRNLAHIPLAHRLVDLFGLDRQIKLGTLLLDKEVAHGRDFQLWRAV